MSDNIQKRDINTAIVMHWHGKTNVVEKVTRENSGICYPMDTEPLLISVPDSEPIETDYKIIVAKDDNLPVGAPITKGYTLISNEEVWNLIESSLAGTKHEIVSTVSVDNRAKVAVSVKLNEATLAANKQTETMLNFIWGHGGKLALYARTGFITICCNNTLTAALNRRGELNLSVKHTKNANTRIPEMGKAIDAHLGVVAEFTRAMNELAAIKCDEKTAREIYAGILVPEKLETLPKRTANTIDRIAELFKSGRGNTGDSMESAFSGFTDYYTHESAGGENTWKQFVSSEFGSAQVRKADTYGLFSGLVASDKAQLDAGRKAMAEVKKAGRAALALVGN